MFQVISFKPTKNNLSILTSTILALYCVINYFPLYINSNHTELSKDISYTVQLPHRKHTFNYAHDNLGKYAKKVIYIDDVFPNKSINLSSNDFGSLRQINGTIQITGLNDEVLRQVKEMKSKNRYFYLSVENTTVSDVLFLNQVPFLKDFRNPCFPDREQGRLHCLPYLFVVGFTKCGTTDFHARITRHPFVTSGFTKEPHWWDDLYKKDTPLSHYIDLFQDATNKVYAYKDINKKTGKDKHPVIIGDFTPRTVWHGNGWEKDILNNNQTEPLVLLPHKIKHLIPMAKIIVLIRNPTERLYSDYIDIMIRYNSKKQPPTPEHFHNLVSKAIEWWKYCVNTIKEKACAYGFPAGLPSLDEEMGLRWAKNTADRLRIGLYAIYLQEWITVFKRQNIEIITLEEYKINPLLYTEKHIIPFLELPPFNKAQKDTVNNMKPYNTKYVRLNASLDLPMWNSTRKLLDQFYYPYNVKLKPFLNKLPMWLTNV